jgi:Sec-independent protein secretion pathway component TatC
MCINVEGIRQFFGYCQHAKKISSLLNNKNRRCAVVGIFGVTNVKTPPDIISTFVVKP